MNLTIMITCAALASIQQPATPPASSPTPPTGYRLLASRAELTERVTQLRLITPEQTPGPRAAEIRYAEGRLETGDFRGGDRVVIQVVDLLPLMAPGGGGGKSPEQQLSDTFTVTNTQELTLPVLGDVPLRGVLRSELESYLIGQIGTRIRNPEVHARALIGLAISGGVEKPGYYGVPADAVVGAVITAAGGGSREGKITDLKILHDGKVVWKGQALQHAIAQGLTLDDLQVQPGDEIAVGRHGSFGDGLRLAAVILSIPVAFLTITRF